MNTETKNHTKWGLIITSGYGMTSDDAVSQETTLNNIQTKQALVVKRHVFITFSQCVKFILKVQCFRRRSDN